MKPFQSHAKHCHCYQLRRRTRRYSHQPASAAVDDGAATPMENYYFYVPEILGGQESHLNPLALVPSPMLSTLSAVKNSNF